MKMRKASIVIMLLLWGSAVSATPSVLKTHPIPGGIVVVPLGKSAKKPEVKFHQNRVLVVKKNHQWFAIVGIPLTSKPGIQQCDVKEGHRVRQKEIMIKTHAYPKQKLTFREKNYVTPDDKTAKRIFDDQKTLTQALNQWTTPFLAELPLRRPVSGVMTSPFGLKRVLNGHVRGRHQGIDLAVPRGTAVHAAGAGKVINTGHYFLSGKTIVIDHGQGLITLYCHLDRIQVKLGKRVKQGQVIGRVGSTGRSTGPHLHWGAVLNHEKVNPFLLSNSPKKQPKKSAL